jgi:hypothetical protein
VHDRTVGGEELIFGNQGALFMNAMTWWDHKTESIWSQPWGRAIAGPLTGTELGLLPSQLVPWKTWRAQHPNTLALKASNLRLFRESFFSGYVIGVTLGDEATAYPYELAEEAGLINDSVGSYPVVVHVEAEDRSVHVYLRQVEDRVLTFVQEGDNIVDQETGSSWALDRGLALEGPLAGQALRVAPYIPAFPDAWEDFYPASRWYSTDASPQPVASPLPAAVGKGNADVVHVRAVQAGDGTWTFHVTVEHPDTGWEDYADGWDVVSPEGEVLKPDPGSPFTRLLLHPHETEQPFTRSQSRIAIPNEVTRVLVRAHDLVDGYGGREVWVDLTVASGEDFEVERSP